MESRPIENGYLIFYTRAYLTHSLHPLISLSSYLPLPLSFIHSLEHILVVAKGVSEPIPLLYASDAVDLDGDWDLVIAMTFLFRSTTDLILDFTKSPRRWR